MGDPSRTEMKKGALEFEEVAKVILALVVLVLVVLLIYAMREKIIEVIRGSRA